MHARAQYRKISFMKAFSEVLRQASESMDRCGVSDAILIGLSGGADSVALTRALSAICEERKLPLHAVYVNHGLRAAARGEEDFCQRLCDSLGISFLVKRVEITPGGNLEAKAREARYAAYKAAMKETRSRILALAHHLDDQAETMLLHLLHGAGADGVGGMREFSGPIWRPLLGLSRRQLRLALEELGQVWCEDESNADPAFSRNYLRNEVLPRISERFPEAAAALGRTAVILQGENDYLQLQAEEWIAQNASQGVWPFLMTAPLIGLHPAMQRRILRAYAKLYGVDLEYDHTERLRELLHQPHGSVCNLPQNWRALRTKDRLHLLPPAPADALPPGQITLSAFTGDVGDGALRQAIPAVLLDQAVLRSCLPGDWISPLGMHGSMKLKDYMISKGIDRPFRSAWPLLCIGSEVLWVIGTGVSEKLRVNADEDPQTYRLAVYSGKLPDAL